MRALLSASSERARGHRPGGTLRTIADGLTAHGFDVTVHAGEQPAQLYVTNVRGALCQLDVTGTGRVTWQFRPFLGTRMSPVLIAGMVMRTLGVPGLTAP